ncbi:MAG TPA: hypothetical protein VFQ80_19200, partial [Thermomicrobiales bacterium]|nr:hypothetical protein [Thermomicrobiales bacterium]
MATTTRTGWQRRFLAFLGAWLLLVAPLSAVVPAPAATAKTAPHQAAGDAGRQSNDAKAAKTNQGKHPGGSLQTTIVAKPERSTDSAAANFTYRSAAPNADFACSLDGADFQACPADGQTYNGLAPGKHRFEVEVIDAGGAADKMPASYVWTIRNAKAEQT